MAVLTQEEMKRLRDEEVKNGSANSEGDDNALSPLDDEAPDKEEDGPKDVSAEVASDGILSFVYGIGEAILPCIFSNSNGNEELNNPGNDAGGDNHYE